MKILVTGAHGQVGAELIRQGEILGFTMLSTDHPELDITQPEDIQRFFEQHQPHIVINAAAYTAVDKAEEEVQLAYAINHHGAANLSRACVTLKIPLLHISTDYLFDGNSSIPYSEEDTPNPQGVYGKSKLQGDLEVQDMEEHIILRVAWVFGSQGNNFVRTMLRLASERDHLRVVADQYGGPTWAGDIAATLLNLAQRHGEGLPINWGTYHYHGSPATSWHGFATSIFEQAFSLGLLKKIPQTEAISSAEYPTPAARPMNSVLDCSKINRTFNIPQPDWHVGLNHVLESWKHS